MIADLLVAFFLLCAGGALFVFFVPSRWNPVGIAVFGSLTAAVALGVGGAIIFAGASFHADLWPMLSLGTLALGADRITGLFLFVSGLVYLPVSIFSGPYLRKYLARDSLRYFGVLYHALFASIVLVLIADDAFSFLVAWELMSITSYLLVTYEYEHEESSQAGFVMLAMSEAGTIAVAIAFVLVGAVGSLDFDALRSNAATLGEGVRWAVLLLSFFGFAVKAGLVPVNRWLPLAHPVAPTNVSALLSTVIVNLGIYGIIRFNLDLVPVTGPGPGLVVLAIGSISALVGILYATIQAEMKRLLAHSTIENMGIVTVGLGAAMVFFATGHGVVAGIALVAALYHLVNHSVYKALLFLGAGAVEGGTGTRDLDRLGGIIRCMPWTSVFFLAGIMSISALPPFNGFVSEWLMLETMLRAAVLSSAVIKAVFALSGAALALTAGLAATCFVKVFAMSFLGHARSPKAAKAKEAPRAVRVPMAAFAVLCVVLGVTPTYVIPTLDRAVSPLVHESAVDALVPPFFLADAAVGHPLPAAFRHDFHDLGAEVGAPLLPGRGLVVLHRGGRRNPVVFAMSTSYMAVVLLGLLGLVYGVFRLLTRERSVTLRPAWDGGLRRLSPRYTYTASGFSNPVRVVFHALLRPQAIEDSTEAVADHFRMAIRRSVTDRYLVDRVTDPLLAGIRRLAALVRRMHLGPVNAYAAYVLVALLLTLVIGYGLS